MPPNVGIAIGTITSAPRPVKLEDTPPVAIEAILSQASDRRSEAQKEELSAHYRSIAPTLDSVRKRFAALTTQRGQLDKAIPTTLVTVAVEPTEDVVERFDDHR